MIKAMGEGINWNEIDVVIGIESRGFILGSALALDLLDPRTRDAVGPAMWLGVAITFVAAALAGWAARARRISAT